MFYFHTRMLNKNKNFQWLKHLILFLFCYLFCFLMYNYTFVYLSKYNISIFCLKFISILLTSCYIIYNLSTLYFLNYYSSLKVRDPNLLIPKYLPNFLKNYLEEVIRISGYTHLYLFKNILITYTLKIFILFFIFVMIDLIFT